MKISEKNALIRNFYSVTFAEQGYLLLKTIAHQVALGVAMKIGVMRFYRE